MKIVIILLFICGCVFCRKSKTVYVCNDVSAYRYHYRKDCEKLKCYDIKSITEDSAVNHYGFLPCSECVKDSSK